ncbi:MAG: alpha-N-arabinofuranosidase, partial [Candidatus Hydrogenedentes bacterium]|nr:alpha-N-arabinofuranosidase [Candidatus Hydrogenedentota bacterium]
MLIRMALMALGVAAFCCGCASAASTTVSIDATAEQEPISPYVYGQFIEHLGRCIYGGIWSEMLEDRKFYYPVDGKQSGWGEHQGNDTTWEGEGMPYEILTASPWQIIGPASGIAMNTVDPLAGEQDLAITLDANEPLGIYHPRLGLQEGRAYTGYVIARSEGGDCRVEVALQWGEGADQEVKANFESVGNEFTKLPFEFTAGADAHNGRVVIRATGQGKLYIGTASLMPADNVEGFRADTLALLRELNAPVYRWPGGNFVSGYDWRDGIGDRDRRPPRKNPAWTGIEHNDVGIHEFMRFCELVNTEPYIALNTGLGDVASAAQEVEYITGAPDTTEGAKRAANGHAEPWPAKWWAVGNEMYGDWQLGHMPLEEYVKKHNAVVDAIRAVSPEAQCIGVGSAGPWSETMLKECADHMVLLSEHLYWQRKDEVPEHAQFAVHQIEQLAKTHRRYREELPSLEGKDIRIALDEWNYWYGPYLYGELGTRYFHRDGLGCAAALQAMFRNSDIFFMANYAQTVNVIGA